MKTLGKFMLNLFGHNREKSNVTPITPFDVEPASVPNPAAETRADLGRHRLMHNISLSERKVASIHRRIVNDALSRVVRGE